MKVLLLNGSSRKNGTTFTALEEISIILKKEGIDSEIFQMGNIELRDCSGCCACRRLGKCVYEDIVNEFVTKARMANAFVFGSPVYYAHPSGRILSFLDRAFYSAPSAFAYKPAAAVAAARRSGTTASFDVLNKYFAICNMPIVSSQYWNNIYGNGMEQARQDEEGLQTMRTLALNMAWMLKCIEAGEKAGINKPVPETKIKTNFIR